MNVYQHSEGSTAAKPGDQGTPADGGMPRAKRPLNLVVLGAGATTTALTLALVEVLRRIPFDPMLLMVHGILPLGAIGIGILAGTGYGLGSWATQARMERRALWIVGALHTLAWMLLYVLSWWHWSAAQHGNHIGFIAWFSAITEGMSFQDLHGGKRVDIGVLGYGVRALEVTGFVWGGLLVPLLMAAMPYCAACQRYFKRRTLFTLPALAPHQSFVRQKTLDAASKPVRERLAAHLTSMQAAIASGDGVQWRTVVEGLAGDTGSLRRVQSWLTVSRHRCPGCASGLITHTLHARSSRSVQKLGAFPVSGAFIAAADEVAARLPQLRELHKQSASIATSQGKIAICVLVCRDVDVPDFTSRQLAELVSAPCIHRILAIPAHMSGDYFHNAAMDRVYCGITVALSNGRHEDGAIPSFISSRVDGARDGFPAETPGFNYAALPDNHPRIPIDSALHRFTASVRGAPFRWSPKGANTLKEECERLNISMAFTDTDGYPCVDLQNRRIEIPVYYLENLWCMCFAGVVLPVHLRTRADEFGTVIQFPQSGEEGAACKLLQWATERMVNGDRLPWPDTVRPDIDAVVGTAMNTANVLFEIAIGFILHHELAHILHDLRVDSADPHNRRRDESLADQIAAAAYVLQNDPDTKKRESRCLGIALAFLDMVGVAIFTVDRLRKSGHPIPNGLRGIGDADHPSSITRLRTFMDDSYFDGTGHCHEICQVMLRLFCTILGLGGIPKKIPSREAGWRKDLALLEEHVMRD